MFIVNPEYKSNAVWRIILGMNMTDSTAHRQIARAASYVMAAFIISTLIGLARQIFVANAFGTSGDLEAFTAANRVSETLFNLVAGGALGSAFIPTFTTLLARKQKTDAWKLASAIANLIFIILSILSILAAFFAPQIVRYLLAPGFSSDPAKEILTISLLRLMLPSVALFGLSGLVSGILNSHQRFLVPALTPAMYSLGIIFGVFVLKPAMGIFGLAWGVILGAALHLGLQIPALLRLNGRYHISIGIDLPPVLEVGRLLGPRLLGVAVVQLNFWINVWLASRMIEGSINGITYAFTLMLMPQAVIAQSIAIAAMPTFSAQIALGKYQEMRRALAASIRSVLFLSIPATFGLIMLRKPVVSVLFQRGEFTNYSAELVAWALLWYATGLVGHSVVEVISRAFYALHDTRTPVFVGTVAMSLNIVLSVLFSWLFIKIDWMPHGGLALANSLATGLEMIGLMLLMRKRLQGLEGRRILLSTLVSMFAAGGMCLVIWGWIKLLEHQPSWIILGGGFLLGVTIYAVILYLMRVEEVLGLVKWTSMKFSHLVTKHK